MSKSKRDADVPMHRSIGTHEVFISHHGLEMKRKFASHLYHSLAQRGIKAFLDSESLPVGSDFPNFMLEAVRKAIIQVPIFTGSYAESRWTLNELVVMMSTESSSKAKLVLPVFYNVKPEDLRKKDGPFGEAIKAHRKSGQQDDEDTIKGWEDALYRASWLEGFRLETYNQREGELLTDLVAKIVQETQDRTLVQEDRNAVGLEKKLDDLLEGFHLKEKRNVYFVLVYGMGGIGKTTLARAVYMRLGKVFEAASFVENCGGRKPSQIQDCLLEDLLLQKDFREDDVGKRREYLKRCLRQKEVLIVLDDVTTNFGSIQEVIDVTSLHPGSRILVTSRNPRVFPNEKDFSDVFRGERYELQFMDDDESLRLFCLHAFRKDHPDPGFERLAMRVSQACGGVPLSLEVLGSRLRGTKDKEFWEEAISMLRSHSISETLRISYEALAEDEQEMFLDVACFLIGEHELSAKYYWDGLVEGWRSGLERLVEMCLVKVGDDKRLRMHDHLRDLGRRIVWKEYKKSGKWSRLWDDKDLSPVLRRKQGLDQIRGIVTSLPSLDAGLLSQMRSLRLLFLHGTRLEGDIEGLKELEIRLLKWNEHPKEELPSSSRVEPKAELPSSSRVELPGSLESQEELHVSGSPTITKFPSSFGQKKKLRKLHMVWKKAKK